MAFLVLFLYSYINSVAQLDGSQIINSCANNTVSEDFFPVKPPVTTSGVGYMKIIIVYVMFNNETKLSGPNETDQDWPINTTNGPSYCGKMLAQTRNTIPDWWNAYNPDNQMVSSWFCENSRGQTHIIGREYFVKLPLSAEEYMNEDVFPTTKERETAINNYIYSYLTTNQGVNWSDYDNWSYNPNTGWGPGADHAIDMIYKIHRYNYYDFDHPEKAIFSVGQFSGQSNLGFGSNTTQDYLYEIITGNNEIFKIIGSYPGGYGFPGSGLIVIGNTTSGVFNQLTALGRLMHENGHYFFNGLHGYVGMMGDVWDLSYSPWEKIALGYITPEISNWQNNGYQEIILDDISARTTNGKYLLSVKMPDDREFIIVARNKVSRWDRPMLGDIAYCNLDAPGGDGVYIYHNYQYTYYYNNQNIDIECADGLYTWNQTGFDAPDWSPNNYWLPVLSRLTVVRNKSDDGLGVDVNQHPETVKDGLTVRGRANNNNLCSKYFSKGKKSTNGGCGWDRIETNTQWDNWTSRENSIDRWDAWKPEYNEIFSPYSSPSTISTNYENSQTGTFIWIKDYNTTTHQTTIRIYRDVVYNTGGMNESDILVATPPSRPMGIKMEEYYPQPPSSVCYPKIVWIHNEEPDMINPDNDNKLTYKIFRAYTSDMNIVPYNYNEIATVSFYLFQTPEYIDFSIEKYDCTLYDRPPYGTPFPVRYYVKAVDKTQWESVPSDFIATEGILPGQGIDPGEGDNPITSKNIPKEFKLFQNYPNPFNPVTNIKYNLPKDVLVTIKIYDMLGREIKTLISENKNAGSYIVTFNGSELASGIYFYRIQAGSFVSVKRMVFIK